MTPEMNAQRTPGPWRIVSDPSHYDTLSTVRSDEAADTWPYWRMIVQVGGAAGQEEQEATARLIAAAPDLLEALEAQADELDRLRAEAVESDSLREKLAGILSRTAVALRGPEPPLTRWSWHDLPERAAAAIAAIDVMQRAAVMAAQDSPPNGEANRAPL